MHGKMDLIYFETLKQMVDVLIRTDFNTHNYGNNKPNFHGNTITVFVALK